MHYFTCAVILQAKHGAKSAGVSLSSLDMERYRKRFYMVDKDRKGFITRVDIKKLLEVAFQFNLKVAWIFRLNLSFSFVHYMMCPLPNAHTMVRPTTRFVFRLAQPLGPFLNFVSDMA